MSGSPDKAATSGRLLVMTRCRRPAQQPAEGRYGRAGIVALSTVVIPPAGRRRSARNCFLLRTIDRLSLAQALFWRGYA